MTRKEIRAEIERLRRLERELEAEEREAYKEKARKFVGKCYRNSYGSFFQIISIPIETWDGHGERFNEYQFPAIFLNYPEKLKDRYYKTAASVDDYVPFYTDTVYFNIERGKPGTTLDLCVEISREEFNAEFDKCIAHFKELIGMSKPESKSPMSEGEFIDRYCGPCGTQRCGGPSDELFREGCQYFKDWSEGRI